MLNSRLNFGLILIPIAIVILLSWYYMLFGMTMNMEPVATWSTLDLIILFLMWAIMMAGMMLPSALPVIFLVDKINQQRHSRNATFTPTLFFALGYLITWCLYSVVITYLQWQLHHWQLLNPMMESASGYFSAAILITAGFYQFSSIKQRCLNLCRSPLSFLTQDWKEGTLSAVKVGIMHGSFCVGCCWFLMAILFVTGVMNLYWIFILSVMVLVEKTLPKGELIGKAFGIMMIGTGLYYLNITVIY